MPEVESTPKFDLAYRKLPREIQDRIEKTIDQLRNDPHHPSLRTHRRRGEDRWQARVTRSYRVYFEMEGDVIRLLHITAHE